MKKSVLNILIGLCLCGAAVAQIPSYNNTAQAGVTLLTGVAATATATSNAIRLPNFSGTGTLTVTETGITGSPSGCTVTLAYQGNNVTTAGAVVSTTSFTPSTGAQTFSITPSVLTGDSYVAVYACSSTYPTAGSINISFSPFTSSSADPCFVSPKQSVSVNTTTATTTQLVALSTGKITYVCGFVASLSGTAPTAQFEYGTGSACGTASPTVLTGPFIPSTGSVLNLGGGDSTKFATAVSTELCLVTGGTGTPTVAGVLTYVQQ
jgi:hypothetical protein